TTRRATATRRSRGSRERLARKLDPAASLSLEPRLRRVAVARLVVVTLPGVVVAILDLEVAVSFPLHAGPPGPQVPGLLVEALRPGNALDKAAVGSRILRLRRQEDRRAPRGGGRDDRQLDAGGLDAQEELRRHRVRRRPDHRKEGVRHGQTDAVARFVRPGGEVHVELEVIGPARL